jgi:hypothetical protein
VGVQDRCTGSAGPSLRFDHAGWGALGPGMRYMEPFGAACGSRGKKADVPAMQSIAPRYSIAFQHGRHPSAQAASLPIAPTTALATARTPDTANGRGGRHAELEQRQAIGGAPPQRPRHVSLRPGQECAAVPPAPGAAAGQRQRRGGARQVRLQPDSVQHGHDGPQPAADGAHHRHRRRGLRAGRHPAQPADQPGGQRRRAHRLVGRRATRLADRAPGEPGLQVPHRGAAQGGARRRLGLRRRWAQRAPRRRQSRAMPSTRGAAVPLPCCP